MIFKGVPINFFAISKMAAIFQNGCHLKSNWEYRGRFLTPGSINLCGSTFQGFLRSRKLNLTFSNSKWRPYSIKLNGSHFAIQGHVI